MKEAERGFQAWIPAIVLAYQAAAELCVLPCAYMWLFCMDLGKRVGTEQRHLGPTLLSTALAVNPSPSLLFIIKLTFFIQALYLLIQTSLPDWNLAGFAVLGRLCCCCHFFKDTLLNIMENVDKYILQMLSYKAWVFSGLDMNEWLKPGRFPLRDDQQRYFLASERL